MNFLSSLAAQLSPNNQPVNYGSGESTSGAVHRITGEDVTVRLG